MTWRGLRHAAVQKGLGAVVKLPPREDLLGRLGPGTQQLSRALDRILVSKPKQSSIAAGLRHGNARPQANGRVSEQPPAPDLHRAGPDTPAGDQRHGSPEEVVSGQLDPGIARNKGLQLEESGR